MKSKPPIDFWCDFISPYGYLASLRIDALAARHGREVRWHPMLLGISVLKVMGLKPIMETPLKQDYVPREIGRYLRLYGLQLQRALGAAPMNPLPAARAFAWLLRHDAAHARGFAHQVYDRYWRHGEDLSESAALADAARGAGIAAQTMALATGAEGAALLRAEVDAAISSGVFGSPFFIVDGEPFFGVDKLELIEHWLEEGGW